MILQEVAASPGSKTNRCLFRDTISSLRFRGGVLAIPVFDFFREGNYRAEETRRQGEKEKVDHLYRIGRPWQLRNSSQYWPPHYHCCRYKQQVLQDVERVVPKCCIIKSREMPQRKDNTEEYESGHRGRHKSSTSLYEYWAKQ